MLASWAAMVPRRWTFLNSRSDGLRPGSPLRRTLEALPTLEARAIQVRVARISRVRRLHVGRPALPLLRTQSMTSSSLMQVAFKYSPVVLLCLLLAACLSNDGDPQQQSPQDVSSDWNWVALAGMENPGRSSGTSRALKLLCDALDDEGVRWVAAGSAGYSLCIDSRDLPRGREIDQQVVDRYSLPVRMMKL